MNWKLSKGNYPTEYISLTMPQFRKLKRQAQITKNIEKLPLQDQQMVYKLLERLLNDNIN